MLGFFMSFVLLMMSLYGFQLVTQDVSEQETRAVYTDIAGRVANGVLTAVDVGTKRVDSASSAETSEILYQHVLFLPVKVHGEQYRVTLTAADVTVTSLSGDITEKATTFNLQTPDCGPLANVCFLGGTFTSNSEGLHIKYEYKQGGSSALCGGPPLNCVTIS